MHFVRRMHNLPRRRHDGNANHTLDRETVKIGKPTKPSSQEKASHGHTGTVSIQKAQTVCGCCLVQGLSQARWFYRGSGCRCINLTAI